MLQKWLMACVVALAVLVLQVAGQASSYCKLPNEACPRSCSGQGDFSYAVETTEMCPTPSPTRRPTSRPTSRPTFPPTTPPPTPRPPTPRPTHPPTKFCCLPGCCVVACCTRRRLLQSVFLSFTWDIGQQAHVITKAPSPEALREDNLEPYPQVETQSQRFLQGNGYKSKCCTPWCLESPCGHGTRLDGHCVAKDGRHECVCKELPSGMRWKDDFRTLDGTIRSRCQNVVFQDNSEHNCAVQGCNPVGTIAGSCGDLGFCKCLPGFGGVGCFDISADFETACMYALPRSRTEGGPCRCLDGVVGERCDRFAFTKTKTDMWAFDNILVDDFGSRFSSTTSSSAKAVTKFPIKSISAMTIPENAPGSSSFLCATPRVSGGDICGDGIRVDVDQGAFHASCQNGRSESIVAEGATQVEVRARRLHKLHISAMGSARSVLLSEIQVVDVNGDILQLVNPTASGQDSLTASAAADGNRETELHLEGNAPWWSGEFDASDVTKVSAVRIFRSPLDSFKKPSIDTLAVWINGELVGEESGNGPVHVLPLARPILLTHTVRIDLPGKDSENMLNLREVQLFNSGGQQVTLFNARQSSLHGDYAASNAVDGDLETISHTGGSSVDKHAPWWAADFWIEDLSQLASIKILNRNTSPTVQNRIVGAIVSIDGVQVGKITDSQAEYTFGNLPDLSVRHNLRIEIPRIEHLHVREVELVGRNGQIVPLLNARQSSEYGQSSVATNAIDGNPNTIAHTFHDGNGPAGEPWWSADFDAPRLNDIVAVRILNLNDNMQNQQRFIGAHVSLDGRRFATISDAMEVYMLHPSRPTGKVHTVRIDLPGKDSENMLNLREVQLFNSGGQQVTLFNARQSSLHGDYAASNAVDGDLETISHTGSSSVDKHAPWWAADFWIEDLSQLASIKILNRNTSPTVQNRIVGAIVSINGVQVGKITDSQAEYTFGSFPDLSVRHNLRIEIPRIEHLHVREVELVGRNGQPIALVNARQSSTYLDSAAANGIDGNPSTRTHTYYDGNGPAGQPWWSVDFDTARLDDIVAVRILNRNDNGWNQRLVGAHVSIDGKRIVTILDAKDEYEVTSTPRHTVRIDLLGKDSENMLNLREVQLFNSGGQQVTLFNARQSSLHGDYAASNAVDGDLETISHTGSSSVDKHAPWWAADFWIEDLSQLASIKILNRNTSPTVQNRIVGAIVSIDGVQVGKITDSQAEYTFGGLPDLSVRHNLRIEIPRIEHLHVREVELVGRNGQPIALVNARQSSTHLDSVAANAIDGNPSTRTHTYYEGSGVPAGQPWWSADFDTLRLDDIVAVRVLNRNDNGWNQRLVGAHVSIDGKRIVTILDAKDEYEVTSKPRHTVRIDLLGKDSENMLNLREVQLFNSGGQQVTLFNARQSSLHGDYAASNAVDGDLETISHTGGSSVDKHAPWWAADFWIEDLSQLASIKILNRNTSPTVQNRIVGAIVSIDGVQVGKITDSQAEYTFGGLPDLSVRHNLRIEIPRVEHLHLREVELVGRNGQPIALVNARQSSTYLDSAAANGIDGNPSTRTHTYYDGNGPAGQPWWSADFDAVRLDDIVAIRILNWDEENTEQLIGAHVSIDGRRIATISESVATFSLPTPWTAWSGIALPQTSQGAGQSCALAVSVSNQELSSCILPSTDADIFAAAFLRGSSTFSSVEVQLVGTQDAEDPSEMTATCKSRLMSESTDPCPCGQQRDQDGTCTEPAAVRDSSWGCDVGVLHGTACYVWGNTSSPQNWDTAREVCRYAFGETLFSLHSESDVTFVLEQFKDDTVGPRKVWLGLSWDRLLQVNSNVEDWILQTDAAWEDGSPFDYDHFGPDKSKLKRYLSDDRETCFFMDLDTGKWDAGDCSDEMVLGCGMQAMPTKCDDGFVFDWTKFKCVQGDAKPAICDANAGYELLIESTCFKVEANARMTFDEAREQCEQEGGHLASFLSIEEHSHVSNRLLAEPSSRFWVGLKDKNNMPMIWDNGVDVNSTIWATLKGERAKTQDPACVFMSRAVPNDLDFAPSCNEKYGFICMRLARGCPQDYTFEDGRCLLAKATALQAFTEEAVCADLVLNDGGSSEELRSKAAASLERTASCLASRSDGVSDWTPKLRRISALAADSLRKHVLTDSAVKGASEEIRKAVLTWFQLGALAAHGPAGAVSFAEVSTAFSADLKPFMQVHSDNDPLRMCTRGPCPCGMWRGIKHDGECTALPSGDLSSTAAQLERSVAYARCAMLNEDQLAELTLVPAHAYLSRAVTCAAKLPLNDDDMRAAFRIALDQIQQVLDAQVRRTFLGSPRLTAIQKMIDIIRQRMDMPPISKMTTVPAFAVELTNEDLENIANKLRDKAQGQLQRELNDNLKNAINNKLNDVHLDLSMRMQDLTGDIQDLRANLAGLAELVQQGFWNQGLESVREDFQEVDMLNKDIDTVKKSLQLKSDQLTHAIRQVSSANDQMRSALVKFEGPLNGTMEAIQRYFVATEKYQDAEEAYQDARKALKKIESGLQIGLMVAGMLAGGGLTLGGAPTAGMMAMMLPAMIPSGDAGAFPRRQLQGQGASNGATSSPAPTLAPTLAPTMAPTLAPTLLSPYQIALLVFGSIGGAVGLVGGSLGARSFYHGHVERKGLKAARRFHLNNFENFRKFSVNHKLAKSGVELIVKGGKNVETGVGKLNEAFSSSRLGNNGVSFETFNSRTTKSGKKLVTLRMKVGGEQIVIENIKQGQQITGVDEMVKKWEKAGKDHFNDRMDLFKKNLQTMDLEDAWKNANLPGSCRGGRRRLQEVEREDPKKTFLNNFVTDLASANARLDAGPGPSVFSNVAQMAATAMDTILDRSETYFSQLCFDGEVVQLLCGDGLYVSCCANQENSCDFGVDADSQEPLCNRLPFEDVLEDMLPMDLPDASHWMADCLDMTPEAIPLMYPAGNGMVLSCCVAKSVPVADRVGACNLQAWEETLLSAELQRTPSQRVPMRIDQLVHPQGNRRSLEGGACNLKAQKLTKMQKLGRGVGAFGVLATIVLGTLSAVLAHVNKPPEFPPRSNYEIFNPRDDQLQEGMEKLFEGVQQIGLSVFSLLQRTTLTLMGVEFEDIPDVMGIPGFQDESKAMPEVWDGIYEKIANVLEYDFELCPKDRIEGVRDETTDDMCNEEGKVEGCSNRDNNRLRRLHARALVNDLPAVKGLRRVLRSKDDLKTDMKEAACAAGDAKEEMCQAHADFKTAQAQLRDECREFREGLRLVTVWGKAIHEAMYDFVDGFRQVKLLQDKQRIQLEGAQDTVGDMLDLEARGDLLVRKLMQRNPIRALPNYERERAFIEVASTIEQTKVEEDMFYAHNSASELLRDYCGAVLYAEPTLKSQLDQLCNIAFGQVDGDADSLHFLADRLDSVRKKLNGELSAAYFDKLGNDKEWSVLDVTRAVDMQAFFASNFTRLEFALSGPPLRNPVSTASFQSHNDPHFCLGLSNVEMREFGLVFYDADNDLIGPVADSQEQKDLDMVISLGGPFVKAGTSSEMDFATGNVVVTKVWEERFSIQKRQGTIGTSEYNAYTEFYEYHTFGPNGKCRAGEEVEPCPGLFKTDPNSDRRKFMPLASPYARYIVALLPDSAKMLRDRGVARIELRAKLYGDLDLGMEAICRGQAVFQLSPPAQGEENTEDDAGFPVAAAVASGAAAVLVLFVLAVLLHRRRQGERDQYPEGVVVVSDVPERSSTVMPATTYTDSY